MREHKNHPVIFPGLQRSIPLPKLNRFYHQNNKIQWIFVEKNANLKKKLAPTAPTLHTNIHKVTGSCLSSLEHTVLFQKNMNENNIFVIQSWGSTKKIRRPPLKIAKIFNFFIFSTNSRKNHTKSRKKTPVFLQNILDLNKKTLEPLFKTATILRT